MLQYSPVWPHANIKQIFPNIFFVTGTNITQHDGLTLQHSRNMIIVRDNGKLSLINSVRLNEKGLDELSSLGKIENVIRIGSFHGRDDAFYLDHFDAKLWALANMEHDKNRNSDYILTADGMMPFPNCKLFTFKSSKFPEAILHINHDGGILITCDSIKNWVASDEFFNDSTAKLYEQQNLFGYATINKIWMKATEVDKSELLNLKKVDFCHLLSAHGEPLLNDAYDHVIRTLTKL
ncbi:MAG: hypothetical protein ACK5Z5_05900 [Neisseriaceae bacterium]